MNTLKARTWCKLDKPLLKFEAYVDDCGVAWFRMCQDHIVQYNFGVPFIDDDWVVEWFIGASDKSGEELYVGDIVEDNSMRTIPKPDKVVYGEPSIYHRYKCRRFVITWLDFGFVLVDPIRKETILLKEVINMNLFLIGNIHENPELLEEKC